MNNASLRLRLYVAGSSPNSRRALGNLAWLRGWADTAAWTIETVDVYEHPDRALADGVMLTPQLVIQSTSGQRAVVGDLSDHPALLAALGLNGGPP